MPRLFSRLLDQKVKQLLPNRPQGTYIVIGKDRPVDLALFLREGQNQLKFIQAPCGHVSSLIIPSDLPSFVIC